MITKSTTTILKEQFMFGQYNQMAQIIINYLRGHSTKEESEKLEEWLDSDPGNRLWLNELNKEDWLDNAISECWPPHHRESFNKTMMLVKKNNVIVIRKRILTAAAVLLAGVIGIYLLSTSNRKKHEHIIAQHSSDNATSRPASAIPNNHATLTLADGTIVDLDSASENRTASQGNYKISQDNSILKYTYAPTGDVSAAAYNTLTTSKGHQSSVILPDGSKAWLNAASSLRYSVTDTGRIRRVEMTGQVYFEVHKDPSRPFIVRANGADIEAIGTRFNVMAYANENKIQTDLLEGEVEISTANQPANRLKAGQSATIIPGKSISIFKNVKIDDAIAWKDDLFVFDAASVPDIMRELSRWYDIEVSYIDTPTALIDARIKKKNSIKDVLTILESSKIHTTMEGNKVKVSSPEIK